MQISGPLNLQPVFIAPIRNITPTSNIKSISNDNQEGSSSGEGLYPLPAQADEDGRPGSARAQGVGRLESAPSRGQVQASYSPLRWSDMGPGKRGSPPARPARPPYSDLSPTAPTAFSPPPTAARPQHLRQSSQSSQASGRSGPLRKAYQQPNGQWVFEDEGKKRYTVPIGLDLGDQRRRNSAATQQQGGTAYPPDGLDRARYVDPAARQDDRQGEDDRRGQQPPMQKPNPDAEAGRRLAEEVNRWAREQMEGAGLVVGGSSGGGGEGYDYYDDLDSDPHPARSDGRALSVWGSSPRYDSYYTTAALGRPAAENYPYPGRSYDQQD